MKPFTKHFQLIIFSDNHTHQERVFRQTSRSEPLSKRATLSTIFNVTVPPIVIHLVNLDRPRAVVRRIRTVVVAAFNGMLRRWFRSNVSKKGDEIIAPSFAHCNAPATIVTKGRSFRIQAPLFHGYPSLVLRRVCQAMCPFQACNTVSSATPTTCAMAGSEMGGANSYDVSAGTQTTPVSMRVFSTRALDTTLNRQSSEYLSSQVFIAWGDPLRHAQFTESPSNSLWVQQVKAVSNLFHWRARCVENVHLRINALLFSSAHVAIVPLMMDVS